MFMSMSLPTSTNEKFVSSSRYRPNELEVAGSGYYCCAKVRHWTKIKISLSLEYFRSRVITHCANVGKILYHSSEERGNMAAMFLGKAGQKYANFIFLLKALSARTLELRACVLERILKFLNSRLRRSKSNKGVHGKGNV